MCARQSTGAKPFALAIVQCTAQLSLQKTPIRLRQAASPLAQGGRALTGEQTAPANAVVIKKYANRRLYNTATSTYVTLDDLSEMVKKGTDFVVYDAKTGEEITRSVLTQIIFEEESKGQNLLPINFLRQLIRFYGDSMQAFVPGYLEFSLESLTKEQEKFRAAAGMEIWGADPVQGHRGADQAQHGDVHRRHAHVQSVRRRHAGGEARRRRPGRRKAIRRPGGGDDLQALKDQLTAMQRKIDSISERK